jgi:hypothetical protein
MGVVALNFREFCAHKLVSLLPAAESWQLCNNVKLHVVLKLSGVVCSAVPAHVLTVATRLLSPLIDDWHKTIINTDKWSTKTEF